MCDTILKRKILGFMYNNKSILQEESHTIDLLSIQIDKYKIYFDQLLDTCTPFLSYFYVNTLENKKKCVKVQKKS